jgi:hypothetical protein
MYRTENTNVLGHVDTKELKDGIVKTSGWCCTKNFEVKTLRVVSRNITFIPLTVERNDVSAVLKKDVKDCGWSFEANLPCELQINVNDQWLTVYSFKDIYFPIRSTNPSSIIVDNFYETPDDVRAFALQCNFVAHPNNHKGKRTEECYRYLELKKRFEEIIGKKIKNWDNYGCNGCFQYCVAGDQLVYHCDQQAYAGVLFLTPDAPVQTGTCLLRSKHTKKMKVAPEEASTVFRNGFLDPTEFDVVDVVGNVYNRLVLFDSKTIHAASEYFGTTKENGRLFQLFFFDIE